jgi:ABC-type anion transport system duplicated permease subunit
VFTLFLAMLHYMIFSAVQGLTKIPKNRQNIGKTLKLKRSAIFRKITLPSILPQLIEGAVISFAYGWNISLITEIMSSYLPGNAEKGGLAGLGNLLMNSVFNGQTEVFASSFAVIIIFIGLFDLIIWQKISHYASRFEFK